MRQLMLLLALLMAFTFMLTTGCGKKTEVVEKVVPVPVAPVEKEVVKEQVIVVREAPLEPPPLRVETRTIAPSPNHVWIPGYYDFNGRDYVWVSGAWVTTRPFPTSVWVPAHWEQSSAGWTWIPGYWR